MGTFLGIWVPLFIFWSPSCECGPLPPSILSFEEIHVAADEHHIALPKILILKHKGTSKAKYNSHGVIAWTAKSPGR